MTTNKTQTYTRLLDKAAPDSLPDLLRKMQFGKMNTPIKVVVSGLTATATPDITTAAVKAAATITGIELESGENLPAIGQVVSLRVAASATGASVGTYGVTDDGGTAIIPPGGASAAMGIAKLSDNGKVLTFPNTVTGFTLIYWPRAAVDMSADAGFLAP
jgi:hypothetical protein